MKVSVRYFKAYILIDKNQDSIWTLTDNNLEIAIVCFVWFLETDAFVCAFRRFFLFLALTGIIVTLVLNHT